MAVRTSTTERVLASLREAILTGTLAPGSLHSIYRLADEHGVSRTPVREAVLRLADAGLVTVERNRGVRVRGVTADDVREVFELRLVLEVPATAYAAQEADDAMVAGLRADLAAMREAADRDDAEAFEEHDRALHGRLHAALGNVRLAEEVLALRASIQARGASTHHRSRGLAEVLQEHVPVVEAVAARDPRAAAARMREHLVHTATLLMRQADGEDPDPGWADRLGPHLAAGGPTTPPSSMLPSVGSDPVSPRPAQEQP